jgi:putative membrane protein
MESPRPAIDLPDATRLAIERTRLAYERTLMAWVRTSTSLISFGFTIYKFFQYLRETQPAPLDGLFGPREFAMLMIGIGVVALALATADHRQSMQVLRGQWGSLPSSRAAILAVLMSVLGVLGLVAVIFRQ